MALLKRQDSSPRHWWLASWLAALLCLGEASAQGVPPTTTTEDELQSVFLLHLARFVRWPDTVLSHEEEPLVIGVLGDERLRRKLSQTVKGERIGTRNIVCRSLQSPPEIRLCHMVYIHRSAIESAAPFIARLDNAPVLLVSDVDGILHLGGHVLLSPRAGQVRLRVNARNLANSQLVASSQLLRIASVDDPSPRRP